MEQTNTSIPSGGKHTLEFRGICKTYPGVKALQDVSFTAESLCPGAAPDNSALLTFDEIESPRATVCGFAVTVAALSLIVAGMVILKSGWLPSPTYLTFTG